MDDGKNVWWIYLGKEVFRLFANLSLRVGLVVSSLKSIISNEEGTLKDMAWTVGAAVVVLLVIVAAMIFVPDTVNAIWTGLIARLRTDLGI